MKVLVVDDDAVSARVTEATLERLGHDVILLDHALGAMSAIAREKPDVALIDVRMPGLGGDRLAAVLVERHPEMSIYLHSSLGRPELEKIARASGAAGFIEKTGDPRAFIQAFERLVAARNGTLSVRGRTEK